MSGQGLDAQRLITVGLGLGRLRCLRIALCQYSPFGSPSPTISVTLTNLQPVSSVRSIEKLRFCATQAMTAEFSKLPWDLVDKMTTEILKIDGISSVLFDVTNKPPGTIEWE